MRKILVFLFFSTIIFSDDQIDKTNEGVEELLEEYLENREEFIQNNKENINYKWEITQGDSYIRVAINGIVTHGSKLSFYIYKDHCDITEGAFSFYTISNNDDIDNLKGKKLTLLANKQEIKAQIVEVGDFALGHYVLFTFGFHEIFNTLKYFEQFSNYEIEIIDNESFKADEYFDINNNNWNLGNLRGSLNKGQELCMSIE